MRLPSLNALRALEAVARMANYTLSLSPEKTGISQTLLDRHYFRKHGAAATYGQS